MTHDRQPAEKANERQSVPQFRQHWIEASTALADATETPSQRAFDWAYKLAIRTIGAAYNPLGSQGIEWHMGQSLARLIADVANDHGYTIS